jgi:hypothetical protein
MPGRLRVDEDRRILDYGVEKAPDQKAISLFSFPFSFFSPLSLIQEFKWETARVHAE